MSLALWFAPDSPANDHRKVHCMLSRLLTFCLNYLKFTGLHPRTFSGLGSINSRSRWSKIWLCVTVFIFLINLYCCINDVWETLTADAPRLKKMEFFSLVTFIFDITMLVQALFSHVYMVIYSEQIFRLIDFSVRIVGGIIQSRQLIQICCFVLAVTTWTLIVMCLGVIGENLLSVAINRGTVLTFLVQQSSLCILLLACHKVR